ncbi:proline-specific peptidase [Mycena vulgaris]|nr:proline-specific peptidase [Mycena vulgaris]
MDQPYSANATLPIGPKIETGYIDHIVGTEAIRTWYKVVGELQSGACPVIILHGGPGLSHFYTLPITSSARLDGVLGHFNVAGKFAATYAARRQSPGLQCLVLTNCPASTELREVGSSALLAALPGETRALIAEHERWGTIDSQEYQDAVQHFNETHLCTLKPWPTDLLQSFSDLLDDPSLYLIMNRPSEFKIIGTLKNWSIIDELSHIACQTLVINGLHDVAQDVAVAPFFHNIPKAKWVQLRASTHMPFFEEPERYFKVVGDFLSMF